MENIEIQRGYDTCPSCKGDGWKSAKLVVMEGTINTKGSLEGVITDPGAFSGGVRNFLLSDRWFSWDNPIEASIGFTSVTGLVEEIKRLMVSHSSKTQMPTMPVEPPKIGLFERITPVEPRKPSTEPPIPAKPVLPEDLPWYKHFSMAMVVALVIAIIVGSAFDQGVGLFLLIYAIPISFVWSLMANKQKKKWYEEELRLYPARAKQSIERHHSDCERYEKELQAYIHESSKADLQKRKEEQEIALYKKQLAEYETEKSNVMKERELLWERARICTRCGTAYLGGDEKT